MNWALVAEWDFTNGKGKKASPGKIKPLQRAEEGSRKSREQPPLTAMQREYSMSYFLCLPSNEHDQNCLIKIYSEKESISIYELL